MLADAASAVADWGERNMGDPQTLKDFVTWTKTNYPATNYLLAFWDHGYMTFQGYTSVDDSSAGDALDEDEQVAAMATVGPVSVVAWDMCNRQMLEVARRLAALRARRWPAASRTRTGRASSTTR